MSQKIHRKYICLGSYGSIAYTQPGLWEEIRLCYFLGIHGDRTQKNGRCFTTEAIYKSTIYKNIYISKKAVFLQVINSYFHAPDPKNQDWEN